MPAARYWRAIGLQPYAGTALELSALHLYLSSGTRIDATAAVSSTVAPSAGTLAALQDDTTSVCRWADVSAPGFAVQWDFGGSPQDVGALRLGGGALQNEFLEAVTLQSSSESLVWTSAQNAQGLVWPGAYAMQTMASGSGPQSYAYWRIYVTAVDGSTTYAAFSEVGFYASADGTGTNLAASRIADSQSGNSAVGGAGAAFDGSLGTEAGSSFPLPYWISARWATPVTVASVALSAQRVVPDRTAKDFEIQGSTDGENWVTVVAHAGATGWAQYERRVFTASGVGGAATATGSAPVRASPPVATVQLSGGMAGNAGLVLSPAVVRLDLQDGGLYRTYGTVELKGTPNLLLRRRVQLWNQRDKRMVRETWSDATTGAWSFDYIRGGDGTRYCVVTYDHTGQKQAQIADNLEPEAM